MKELNELEKTELAIERIKSALSTWQRQSKLLEIDPRKTEQRTDELLAILSDLIKKKEKLKK